MSARISRSLLTWPGEGGEGYYRARHKGHYTLAQAARERVYDAARAARAAWAAPTSAALHVSAYARVTAGTLLAHD